jgi:magnesium chelatase accessory protein
VQRRIVADHPLPPWWPHAERSRFIRAGGLHWHVQRHDHVRAQAPVALLLHGAGAGCHSWRHLAPLLAHDFTVVAPDLPGHAFTRTPRSQALSLPAVSNAVMQLLQGMALRPTLVVGHSAGAAVALRLLLDGAVQPAEVVSINGALLPPSGPVGRWFQPLAQTMARNPLVAPAFAAWAHWPGAPRRLLNSTGSNIDALGERCYAHLVRNAQHAAGALRLMAQWDLASLLPQLPRVAAPLLLLAGSNDRTLPPQQASAVARLVSSAKCVALPGLGHLAHEEDAPAVLAAIQAGLDDAGRAYRTAAASTSIANYASA